MIEILILSLVQGITEFLPISSSSHLIIISEYLKFDNQKLEIDIGLHIGSFLAVIFFLKKIFIILLTIRNFFLKFY
jgi:undecaprenyl-diphosphatase